MKHAEAARRRLYLHIEYHPQNPPPTKYKESLKRQCYTRRASKASTNWMRDSGRRFQSMQWLLQTTARKIWEVSSLIETSQKEMGPLYLLTCKKLQGAPFFECWRMPATLASVPASEKRILFRTFSHGTSIVSASGEKILFCTFSYGKPLFGRRPDVPRI